MKIRHWYVVHGKLDVIPSPTALLNCVRPRVSGLTYDGQLLQRGGWQDGGLRFLHESAPAILVGRLVSGDEFYNWDRAGWDAELRSWNGPNGESVIEHLRQTCQSITITPIMGSLGQARLARICEQICGQLAQLTEGLIHVYQAGFFDAKGESLHPYCPKHRLRTA
ncbi:hypothetical protein Psta_0673 [Pirellula staleyi DSM 6068]|uniref:Uncharacterized protein n=1 Tax=Pirellula staleyi (strain ATCC 27377 / DSM 6068 / ICPB 4128) TaxID=530564 RepID=D2R5A0_PIRSD|nr:hypothetical protein [Pirellula staleyi]ADB15359.1 hypothetical protein Psta_0673 [Pirellula staleyi DSM 6068]